MEGEASGRVGHRAIRGHRGLRHRGPCRARRVAPRQELEGRFHRHDRRQQLHDRRGVHDRREHRPVLRGLHLSRIRQLSRRAASRNRFFPTLGNHDWETAGARPVSRLLHAAGQRALLRLRPLSRCTCSPSTAIRTSPMARRPASVQAQWLQSRLAASTLPFRFVVLHHAPFSSGPNGSDAALQWPYRSWGASAGLAGHDHTYERIIRDGLPYFVNGAGGYRALRVWRAGRGQRGPLQRRLRRDAGRGRSATGRSFKFVTRTGVVVDSFNVAPRASPSNRSLALERLHNCSTFARHSGCHGEHIDESPSRHDTDGRSGCWPSRSPSPRPPSRTTPASRMASRRSPAAPGNTTPPPYAYGWHRSVGLLSRLPAAVLLLLGRSWSAALWWGWGPRCTGITATGRTHRDRFDEWHRRAHDQMKG